LYLSNRLYVWTGLVIIGIAVCLVLGIGLSIAVSSNDPSSKSDVAKYMKDVYDHRTLFVIDQIFFVTLDSILVLLVGAFVYLVFRDRSHVLALVVLVGHVGAAATGAASDALRVATLVLAKDFVHGGAGVSAGDNSLVELTHIIGRSNEFLSLMNTSMLGLSFLAMGWLIVKAPEGKVNPPRAIGWIILVAGLAFALAWTDTFTSVGRVFLIINALATIIFTIWLGSWLIKRSSELPDPIGARP
jgi:Domain of unknown function (DUF4386)